MRMLNSKSLYSKSYRHVPGGNYHKADSGRVQKMCGECLACERYVKTALDNRKSLDAAKRRKGEIPAATILSNIYRPKASPFGSVAIDKFDREWPKKLESCTNKPE